MKKLLALLVAGGLLALTTGCPPGTTSGPMANPNPGPSGTTPPPIGSTGHPGPGTTTTPPAGESKEAKGTVKIGREGQSRHHRRRQARIGPWTSAADTKVMIDGKNDKAENIKVGSDRHRQEGLRTARSPR